MVPADCPSCQAGLVDSSGDAPIPGVTSVDPSVIAAEAATRKQLAKKPAAGPLSMIGSTVGGALGGPLGSALGRAVTSALVDGTAHGHPGPGELAGLGESGPPSLRPMADTESDPWAPRQDPWAGRESDQRSTDGDPWSDAGEQPK